MDTYYEEGIVSLVYKGHDTYATLKKAYPRLTEYDFWQITQHYTSGDDDAALLYIIYPANVDKWSHPSFQPDYKFALTNHGYAVYIDQKKEFFKEIKNDCSLGIAFASMIIALFTLFCSFK